MAATSFEHAQSARAALRAIVADPEHGPAALDSLQTVVNLLQDLLPEAPRESGLLIAAVSAGLPSMLRNNVAHGMDQATAISLAAATLESRTAFTAEACWWAASELAFALGLADAETVPATPPVPPTEVAHILSQKAPVPAADVTQTAPRQGLRRPGQQVTVSPSGPARRRLRPLAVAGIGILTAAAAVSVAIILLSHKPASRTPQGGDFPHASPASKSSAAGYAAAATMNPGAQGSMTSIAWVPDGSIVATGDKDGNTYLWDPRTGQMHGQPFAIRGAGKVYAIAISPDGSILAAGYSNGSTYLWTLATRTLIAVLRDPGPAVNRQVDSVAFSLDGQLLVSADGNGSAYLWHISPGHQNTEPAKILPDPAGAGVWSAVFSSQGTLATGDYHGNIYLWNTSNGAYRGPLGIPGGNPVTALAFSPDSSLLAAGSGSVTTDTGSLYGFATATQTSKVITSGGAIWALSFVGNKLAAADGNGTTDLWNVNPANLTATAAGTLTDPHTGPLGVGAVGFSPDHRWLVTGDTNGQAYTWSNG